MEKKYELTDITKKIIGDKIGFKEITVYRIRALKDFDSVKKGDLGGWVESEDNLSHNGTCWIFNDAMIYGNAKVYGDAIVSGNSCVHGNARIFNSARISDYARVFNKATIHGKSKVYGSAKVCEHAIISGNAYIGGTSIICAHAVVSENACVRGNSTIVGDVQITGTGNVCDSNVKGNAVIGGFSRLNGATVGNNANINDTSDYLVIGPIGSRNDKTTFYKGINGIYVHTGCFEGTLKQFEDAVNETHKNNEKYRNQYLSMIKYVKENLMEDN